MDQIRNENEQETASGRKDFMDAILKEIVVSEISSSQTGFVLDGRMAEIEESDEGETTTPKVARSSPFSYEGGGVSRIDNELDANLNNCHTFFKMEDGLGAINDSNLTPMNRYRNNVAGADQHNYMTDESYALQQQQFSHLSSNLIFEHEISDSEVNQQKQLQIQQLLEKAAVLNSHLTMKQRQEMRNSMSRTSAHLEVEGLLEEEESQPLQAR